MFELICITKSQDNLLLQLASLPQWEEFIPWGKAFLDKLELNSPVDVSEGADRHMLVFTFNRSQFSLNYESYSESIWIAPLDMASVEQLDALESQLRSVGASADLQSDIKNSI